MYKRQVERLSDGEKAWNMFIDTGLLLNNPMNVTPIAKPKKSGDLFGSNVEPHYELSQHLLRIQTGRIRKVSGMGVSYFFFYYDLQKSHKAEQYSGRGSFCQKVKVLSGIFNRLQLGNKGSASDMLCFYEVAGRQALWELQSIRVW